MAYDRSAYERRRVNSTVDGIDDSDLLSARLGKFVRSRPQARRVSRSIDNAPRLVTSERPNERCGLCGNDVPSDHRHLLDCSARRLICACRACSLLFDNRAAGGRHYRLIPDRYHRITDFALTDDLWTQIGVPVDVAFFFFDTTVERIVALYPGALGVTESQLAMQAWSDLAATNPVLDGMERDVEALLVNRARGARDYWIVPVDACYALAGTIRQRWSGFTGGDVWSDIADFFTKLQSRATPVLRTSRPSTPFAQKENLS